MKEQAKALRPVSQWESSGTAKVIDVRGSKVDGEVINKLACQKEAVDRAKEHNTQLVGRFVR